MADKKHGPKDKNSDTAGRNPGLEPPIRESSE